MTVETNNAYENCTGCALCLLNCPLWRSTKDVLQTPFGRFKAMQLGHLSEDVLKEAGISEGIESCVLCGSCEVLCPTSSAVTEVTISERAKLNVLSGKKTNQKSRSGALAFVKNTSEKKEVALFIGTEDKDTLDSELIEQAVNLFGGKEKVALIEARTSNLESALAVMDNKEIRRIFKGAKEIVSFEGLLLKPLRKALSLPKKSIISLGERLLKIPKIRQALLASDLYIIDARSYNLDYERLVNFYDEVKKDIGLSMNLDLHRSVTTLGRDNLKRAEGEGVSELNLTQARWILEGRRFKRIVTEHPADALIFRKVTDVPVLSILELAKD
ncbi:MAG: 4Fe-4S dicluster domain-containing protein [Deltaproteobacteria bacterium]|nr:4Fe-4S dicluster domain-containing protein [Deltaproteobacteria bacterium]